jgi:hypothetical protein
MVDRAIIMTHMALRDFGSYENMVQTLRAQLPRWAHRIIRDWGRGEGKGDVSRHCWPIVFGIVSAVASGPSVAQDFTEGKSPAQLFAGDCAACHKSPQGLAKSDARSVASFLREHYTTKPEMADALAAYLLASGKASTSNETGRTDSGRGSNRNAEGLRPRGSIPTGDETRPPDSGEAPKSSAKLRSTGKPTENEPRRVHSAATTSDGAESTDEKDGAKPAGRLAPDAKRDADEEGATDTSKPKPRAASREGVPPVATGKLNAYARSGTSDKDKSTESAETRLSKLRSYANSGEAAPPAITAPPKAVASPPLDAAIPTPTAVNPPPVVANSPPVQPATALANPGRASDGERPAITEEPKAPPEDATHAESIDAPKPIVDEGSKPKPRKPAASDGSRSQDGASARPTGRADSAANVPTSPMSFLGRILSGNVRQSNPN